MSNKELYDLLEIEPSASPEEIRKAFRNVSKKHHPDRGGDEETFKKINSAYEILNDPQKREIYDKYGKDGLKNSGTVPEDMFSSMFGMLNLNNMFGNFFNQKRKTESTIHKQMVTLENLCTRKVIKLKVTRDRVCECFSEQNSQTCNECQGRGVTIIMRQFGPMIQQIQQNCNRCQGLGKVYNSVNCNKGCKDGILQVPKIFEIHLTPNLENGYKYIFKEEGNQNKGCIAGDFIVLILYEKHPVFEVQNKDLIVNHTISLKEALCGHELFIDHPSGEKIQLRIEEVTTPYTNRFIQKGLTDEGKLEIRYKIDFPDKLDIHQKEIIGSIF